MADDVLTEMYDTIDGYLHLAGAHMRPYREVPAPPPDDDEERPLWATA